MSEINNIKTTGQAGVNSTLNVDGRDNLSLNKSSETAVSEVRRDTVSLTNTATQLQSLQQTLSNVPEVNAERVEALRAAIADGTYKVDPEKVAQNLIEFERQLN
jgi:negative regulator of flagellin synthesis FlgM